MVRHESMILQVDVFGSPVTVFLVLMTVTACVELPSICLYLAFAC